MDKSLPEYKIIRSGRRTLGLQVTKDGVVVRAPYLTSERTIRRFVTEHLLWIEKQMKRQEALKARTEDIPRLTEKELRTLKENARADLSARVRHYASLMGVSYGRITIRAQKSRWGSCSREGNLSFNCLLMLAPEASRDSTVVHELCHRRHMDHSAAFYKEVYRYCPDYDRSSAWLRAHGPELIARLPDPRRSSSAPGTDI